LRILEEEDRTEEKEEEDIGKGIEEGRNRREEEYRR
jgi:hypothetical protein